MPDAPPLMTVAEAEAILDAEAVGPRVEWAALGGTIEWDGEGEDGRRVGGSQVGAEGRRLAANILADRDYPPFDKSLMDGFAIRSVDVAGRDRATLHLVGEVAAGGPAAAPLAAGQAVRIMTGAPLPPGADAVIPVEHSVGQSADGFGTVGRPATLDVRGDPRSRVQRRGAERTAGEIALAAGVRLGPSALAVAAQIGAVRVQTFAPPAVAVVTTGDEIVPPGHEPGPGQIRNASATMLAALAGRLGCSVRPPNHVPDDADATSREIRRRLTAHRFAAAAEVLLLTGGMSMGRHDHVPTVLRDLGCEFRISKVAMKPGKPFVFAVLPKEKSEDGRPRYVFGLPGNPVSAFVCTLRLASRLIARLGGGPADEFTRTRPGVLADPLPANGPREFYQPCRFDGRSVTPLHWRGSADVFTLAAADALIVRPADDLPRAAGEPVEVLEIPR